MNAQNISQSVCSDLVTRTLAVIICPGTREDEVECDDSTAANDTRPVLSSDIDVLGLRFPGASSEYRIALSIINKTAVNLQRTCKGSTPMSSKNALMVSVLNVMCLLFYAATGRSTI